MSVVCAFQQGGSPPRVPCARAAVGPQRTEQESDRSVTLLYPSHLEQAIDTQSRSAFNGIGKGKAQGEGECVGRESLARERSVYGDRACMCIIHWLVLQLYVVSSIASSAALMVYLVWSNSLHSTDGDV